MQYRDGSSVPSKEAPNARRLRNRHQSSSTPATAARSLPLGRPHATDGEDSPDSLESWSCVEKSSLHGNAKEAANTDPKEKRREPSGSSPVSSLETQSLSLDGAYPAGLDQRHVHAYQTASKYPPVTRDSLSELDIVMIINNPKLRHDVNFDRELHFRPNDDGEQGALKKGLAEQYWLALVPELMVLVLPDDGQSSSQDHGSEAVSNPLRKLAGEGPRRMPLMFKAIRDILKSLVPERDHGILDETLDVPLLMQQIEHRTCDLVKLSQWLASLLKTHCAPMRDNWVDDMVDVISRGLQSGDMNVLVEGLRLLFGILEAMKLDVANHQTRSLRPLLIEDTVNFEQRYFLTKIANLQIGIRHATDWYRNAGRHSRSSLGRRKGDDNREPFLGRFFDAFTATCFSPSAVRRLPDTFRFDVERIQLLHADIRGTILLDVCSRLYTCLLQSLGYTRHPTGQMMRSLQDSLLTIIATSESPAKWSGDIGLVASEIVRCAYKTCGLTNAKSQCDYVEQLERHLEDGFKHDSGLYQGSQLRLEEAILPLVDEYVQATLNLSPLEVFNLADPRKVGHIYDGAFRGLNDIAVRLAHIGTLHWRVWGAILYMRVMPELSRKSEAEERSGSLPNSAISPHDSMGMGRWEDISKTSKRRSCPQSIAPDSLVEFPS